MFTLALLICFLLPKSWSAKELQQDIEFGDVIQIINISQFCQHQGFQSDTVVELAGGDLVLNSTCVVKDVENWTLRAHSDVEVATIRCSRSVTPDSGFKFINVQNLSISHVEFFDCGSWLEVKLIDKILQVESALFFINGCNLFMYNVNVSNPTSAGIVVLNVAGSVNIDTCVVQNALSHGNSTAGGTVVAYDKSTTVMTTLEISNSKFIGNGYEHYRNCTPTTFGTVSYSSGMVMFLGSPNLRVRINSSDFSNNSGCSGGNMAVYLSDYCRVMGDPSIYIENTNFLYGKARHGAGLFVSFQETSSSQEYNTYKKPVIALVLTKSLFEGNYAEQNGGGFYMQWTQSLQVKLNVDAVISHTDFINNRLGLYGYGGLALHYQTYSDFNSDPHKFIKFRVSLKISSCSFHRHYQSILTKSLLSRRSVIQVKSVPYLGLDSINITSNNCTALMAIGSNLVFYNSSTIRDNLALTGAGIRLCSSSLMYFNPHTTLEIVGNSAEQRGGGILVSSNCLVSRPLCFYQFTPEVVKHVSLLKTINVTIKDNSAPKGGANIFGGSLDYCYLLSVRLDNNHFKRRLNVPENTLKLPSSISSNPQQVCFHKVNGNRCGKNFSVSIYPGDQVTHNFSVVGQLIGSVSGTVRAWMKPNTNVTIDDDDRAQTISILGQVLKYKVYSTEERVTGGEINFEADLECNSDVSDYARRLKPAAIKVTFLSCPFGFLLTNRSNNQYLCDCSKNPAINHCNISKQTITKKSNQWIGSFASDNTLHLASGRCPLDYCDSDVSQVKALSDHLDEDWQCRYNRTGVLCGSCPKGWSLVLGSSECREHCSNAWLLLIVPFALAGLLLVLVIHFLNLTVTMGTVCGLIFYANVIQDYSISLLSEHPIPGLTPFLRVFLAWLNLDFGIPTCFYDGMRAFGKTMIQVLFPLYIWAISATIILLSRRYISVTRFVGNNAVKVLATLLLLSYSKMLRVSIKSLNLVYLNVLEDGRGQSKFLIRWAADGNVSYTSASHLILVILTVLFLIISLPFSMILLCIKHAYSLPNYCRLFSWIDKLKPFFDAYMGPYKDNARFWTGLLLFIRILYLTVHTIDYNSIFEDIPYKYAILVNFFLCSLMIPLKGVYKKHWFNVLEGSLLFNMGLLFITRVGKPSLFKSLVANVLVFCAFLTFLGIVAYHVHLKFSGCLCLTRRAFWRRRNADLDVGSFEDTRGADYMDNRRDIESTEDEDLLQPIT